MNSFKTSSCLGSQSEMNNFEELLSIASGNVGLVSGQAAYSFYAQLEGSNKGLPAIAAGLSQRVINACREKCLRHPSVIKVPSIMNAQESVSIILFMYLDEKIRALSRDWIGNLETLSRSFENYPPKTREVEDLLAFYGLHKPLEVYLSVVDDPQLTLQDLQNAFAGAASKAANHKIVSRAYPITKEKITAQWRFMEDVGQRASEALKKRSITIRKRRDEQGKVVVEKTDRYEVSDSAAELRVLINRLKHSNSDSLKKGIKGLTSLQAIYRGKRVREPYITDSYKQGSNDVLTPEDIAWKNAKNLHELAKVEQDRALSIFQSANEGVENVYTQRNKTREELDKVKSIQKTLVHCLLSILTFGILALCRYVICHNLNKDIENSAITLDLALKYKDECEKKLRETETLVEKTHQDLTLKYEELKAMHKARRDALRRKRLEG